MRPTYFTRSTLSCLVYGFIPFFPVLAKLFRNPARATAPSKSFDSLSSYSPPLSLLLFVVALPRHPDQSEKDGRSKNRTARKYSIRRMGRDRGGSNVQGRSREAISENGEFSGISCEQQPLIKYDIIPIPGRTRSPSTSPNMAKAKPGPRTLSPRIESRMNRKRFLSLSLYGIDSLLHITWESHVENTSGSWILCWFARGRESTSRRYEREGITMKAERSCNVEMNRWLEMKSLSDADVLSLDFLSSFA